MGGVPLGALLYKSGKLRYPTARHNPKHNHTHNNQHEQVPSYPPAALVLSLQGNIAMDLDLGAAAPYGSEAGAGRSVCSYCCQFSQLEHMNRTHKKL